MMGAILGENLGGGGLFVDIDDALDLGRGAGCGVACLGAPGRSPVITRSGRAVKTGHLKNMSLLGGRLPGEIRYVLKAITAQAVVHRQ